MSWREIGKSNFRIYVQNIMYNILENSFYFVQSSSTEMSMSALSPLDFLWTYVGCCFFTPLFITFHHKNNQNMLNFHNNHPNWYTFFQFAKWKITILRFGTTIKDYKGTMFHFAVSRGPRAGQLAPSIRGGSL